MPPREMDGLERSWTPASQPELVSASGTDGGKSVSLSCIHRVHTERHISLGSLLWGGNHRRDSMNAEIINYQLKSPSCYQKENKTRPAAVIC